MQHTSSAPGTPFDGWFTGLVVVELGSSIAAPFACQILGELGAQVIKIEKPEGDDARRWGPPFWEGASAYFQAMNCNKQSVVFDLRADRERIVELIVEKADVVVQNLRPGQVEQLGLDAATLCALKPSLIYCNMGAFGREGPLNRAPGYDPLMQAFGGIMSTTGEPGQLSVRVGASIVDLGTGMWAVIGILGSLLKRATSGRGGVVDVSLFETSVSWVSLLVAQFLASGKLTPKLGSRTQGIVPYKAYATADGEIVVAAGSDGLFRSLARALGHPEWLDDPKFATNPARVEHQVDLYARLDALFAQRPTVDWVAALEAAGVPCAPVNNLEQMLAHPQTQALQLLRDIPGTGMQAIALPLSIDGIRPAPVSAPPTVGQHTATVLGERR